MAEYREYYAIKEPIQINVLPLDADSQLPDEESFLQEVPEVFRLASEMHGADAQSIAAIRNIGDNGRLIADILSQQNRKLNALLGYLLSREDASEYRYQTLEYGGGGVSYLADAALPLQQLVELKLFMPDESAAIFSYARVIDCLPEGEQQRICLLFERISDDDREVIVRASLHAQSRLLKKRAAERNTNPSA
ncbi:PilZ domain-containing protein [Aliidiomarina minuta]|uniref:PilZ domain-containing protein n=2 Tax=Aliidiomarina minuta TaxID=880057 RepID=A0A432W7A4_9GAMM|nr:PilZ domain-containing protein [Aliidiomarina minuta]